MLQLYDTAHNKLCGLQNYSDLYVEQAIGSSTTPIVLDQLHFKYPQEDAKTHLIDYECYIGTPDAEYIVKEINLQTADGDTAGPTWVEYVCDLNIEPIKGTLLDNFTPGSTTADAAANLALAGTGWVVGYCDVTKRRTAAGTNCTAFDALTDIAAAYSCEIIFDVYHKLVNIHQQQGADRGAYFAEDLNLKTLQVQGNSRDYVTRLYPIGKDGMTISSVNGGAPYVSNYQYSTKIISAYWTDNRYTVPADMLADAQDRLDYLSKPTRAYSADIVDLARVSDNKWDLLDFALGDMITLLSYSAGVREQQRIVKIDRYLEEPERSTCEISNKIASLDDIILRVSDAADTVDDATDSTGAIMGSSVQVTNPDGTYTTLTATVATIGSLIATKATITDLQAQSARIDNLVATSVTTDYLTANYLTADSIQSNYATIGALNAQTARIDNLVSSQITTDYLAAHYAEIDLSNIGTGVIQTAMIATGAVDTAQIADGSITDAKIVSLSADRITAGTLSVERLIITGSTQSIVYTVNEANGTAQLSQTTIDGGSLTQRTITADRIVAGAITANEIASKTITADRIAAGTITAAQIQSGSITADRLDVIGLINSLNVSTQTLYAQRITTSGSTVYGTIGSWTGKVDDTSTTTTTLTGFIVRDNANADLYHMVVGPYGDDGTQITSIRAYGPMYTRALGTNTTNNFSTFYMGDQVQFYTYVDDGSGSTLVDMFQLDYNGLVYAHAGAGDNKVPHQKFSIDSTGKINGCNMSTTASGVNPVWPSIPIIKQDGVMEIGRYIDFHLISGDSADSASRIACNTDGSLTLGLHGIINLHDDSSNIIIQSNYAGSGKIYLSSNGGVNVMNNANTSWTYVSAAGFTNASLVDYKQDIHPAERMLEKVKETGIMAYRYIADAERGITHLNYGCVIGDGYRTPTEIMSADGKAVNQYSMTAVLWRAVQDLAIDTDTDITSLRAQIAALQTQVAALEAA